MVSFIIRGGTLAMAVSNIRNQHLGLAGKCVCLLLALVLVGCTTLPPPNTVNITVKPSPPVAKPIKTVPKSLSGLALVNSLLPPKLEDRNGWAADIFAAFEAIKIVPLRENICAVVAEIEQESSFQTDPPVPGLSRIVRHELDKRREKYHIPLWLMNSRLNLRSPGGSTYNERIDTLKTENDVNVLYQDIIAEIPFGKKLLADYNPVHTGGPMQVSMTFANTYVTTKPYPYTIKRTLRDELFTRAGGVFFGVAYLLDYPANYADMIFRFADFNAGIYSSRNAAFQHALHSITGITLQKDGDLLRYQDGAPDKDTPSQTMQALLTISSQLQLAPSEIFRDLLLEKSAAFEQTQLYLKLFALAPSMPKAYIPEIVLSSPKFTRKLTTVNYAKQVDARYQRCLKNRDTPKN